MAKCTGAAPTWPETSHTGRKLGQQWILSSQQVAPGVGQHPQPFAGSLEPGSWQQVLLKGHAACEKIQWDSAVNRRVVSNADGSIDRADVKPSAREIGVYVPRGQYSRLC
jgi:hypothetical protein